MTEETTAVFNPAEISQEQLIRQVAILTDTQKNLIANISELKRKAINPFSNFQIPDQIKIIPEFNGNRKETLAWIEDTQEALELFEDFELEPCYKQIMRVVKSRLVGEAREVIIAAGNPSEWSEIKTALLNAFGDKRDITSHIQSLFYIRQGKKSLSEYFHKLKSIDTAIKTSAAQMDEYKGSTEAVNALISLMTLTRYIDGLNGENVAMYVRSYRPKSLEEAHDITVQHSNAAFRQKMENRHTPSSSGPSNTNQKYQNKMETARPQNNNNNNNNHHAGHQKPNSGKFKQRSQLDEDVSMRTHLSKMQINNHTQKKTEVAEESEEERETPREKEDNAGLDSEDDDYFNEEEINFHLSPEKRPKK